MEHSTAITERARGEFNEKQVELIAATVAQGLSPPELGMFLELSARYQLDPFAGQIFAAKMPGRNGGKGRVAIIVPRDGFLTVAARNPNFDGLEGDVVREKDEFQVLPDRSVQHTYSGGPKVRGEIVGAWAIAYRKDRSHPTYFFAPWEEYNAPSKPTWKQYPSAMILKVAEINALKKAFNITGLIGEEESHTVLASQGAAGSVSEAIDWGGDPIMADRLKRLYEDLNHLVPGSYRPAKIKAELQGLDDEGRLALAQRLEGEVIEQGGEIPEPAIEGEVESL